MSQQPDEMLSIGPVTLARYGKNIVSTSNWPEGTFEQTQKKLRETYPKIVNDIDSLVVEIADLISALPPGRLLHQAWWEMAQARMKLHAESDVSSTQAIYLRMIDYVQSVIASVPPAHAQQDEVSDEEWLGLKVKVDKLFDTLNISYQLCRSAKARGENPEFDSNFERLYYKAQIYWCNVRGTRYQVHDPAYLKDVFLPHSAIFCELFNISVEDFVSNIAKIWHVLSFGLEELFHAMTQFQKDVMDAVEKKLSGPPSVSSEKNLEALIAQVVKENHWEERQSDVLGRFLGMDLFDVQKNTSLPQRLLDELTWSPGEEKEFFREGEFRGWPLRIWPIFTRPFIRLNGRCYCFDLYSLVDNIYRVMQRTIVRLKPEYRENWNEIQRTLSEDLPFKYLQQLLPGSKILRSVYYRGRTNAGTVDWCETDGLVIYDDHLFVVEVRGGAFTYTAPATDFPAYMDSLRSLLLKPAAQGKRFVDYIRTADAVGLFDAQHNQIGELRSRNFRQITVCAVTLDQLTEIGAQVQHLAKIGVDVGPEPVWAVSVDDLRVYVDVFENPLLFLHYVEQRMKASRSSAVQLEDELDHLVLYLNHNDYAAYAEEMQHQSGRPLTELMFEGYRSEIDKFFNERMFDAATPCPLKQRTPARILKIVEFLSQSSKPGRVEIASYLLDLADDARQMISDSIDDELLKQVTSKRPIPFSTLGGVNLTVVCWTQNCQQGTRAQILDYARSVFFLYEDKRRLLLELVYSISGSLDLEEVSWHWIDLASIPLARSQEYRAKADRLRRERIVEVKTEKGKIGRNDRCPCGSGKKYKRCCLAR